MTQLISRTPEIIKCESLHRFGDLPFELLAGVLYQYFNDPWTVELSACSTHTVSCSKNPFLVSKHFRNLAIKALLATGRGTLVCMQHSIAARTRQWFDLGIFAVRFSVCDIDEHIFDSIHVLRQQLVNLEEVDGGRDLDMQLQIHQISRNPPPVATWRKSAVPAPDSSLQDVLRGAKNEELVQWTKQAWSQYIGERPNLQHHNKIKFRLIKSCLAASWSYEPTTMAESCVHGVVVCMESEINERKVSLKSIWLESWTGLSMTEVNQTPQELADRLRCFESASQDLQRDRVDSCQSVGA